jgi:hypothetical protein
MTAKGDFIRALHKIMRYYDQWCGCLTPSEILALVENGICDYDETWIDYAKQMRAKGDCSPFWFYFKLGKLKDNPSLKETIMKQNISH